MTRPVRVLILHESSETAARLVEELERGGFAPAFERVSSRETLEQALSAGTWDVVLSDDRIAGFGAFAALALVKEQEPDLPFLVVSRNIGEETAVRAILAGTDICIPMEELGRLAATVERELRAAGVRRERRKDRLALRESEGRFRALIETAPDAMLAVDDAGRILRAERAATQSEMRYRMLFDGNLAGVYRTTLEGKILDCNDSFAHIFGYSSRDEVLSLHAWDFYLTEEDRDASLARLKEHRNLANYEQCLRRKDGSHVWVLENGNLIEGTDGDPSLIEGTVIDITERKRSEERVKHLAFHDSLTGLPNRLLFNDRLRVAMAHATRYREKLAVLFLDIDRFKVINDSLGHPVGDELLRRVAERVAGCIRQEDTIARLGGDEFTVLLPGIAKPEDAATIALKILEAVRLPFFIEHRELFITTSIGVTLFPEDGLDPESLVRNADTAMYRAKEQGRDNTQLYAPGMNTKALERLSLEGRLRQALQNRELVVHYQPLIDLTTGKIRGAEALLRWQHPDLGLLAPGEFIGIAEVSGLIVLIGQWVLRTACAQARAWQLKGYPTFSVAVNLSARQFQQADLVFQVTEALHEADLPAASLDLEITESNAMQNAELSIATLQDLKRLGVSLSMDDFGTGYSSLNYLKRFPIDRIKIDQSFVRDITRDPDDAAIASAIIAMAHSLKLTAVAEGVETEEQLELLRAQRCDEMQGYLFSPPVPAPEFEELLESGKVLGIRQRVTR